jgi:hypothetical protein
MYISQFKIVFWENHILCLGMEHLLDMVHCLHLRNPADLQHSVVIRFPIL